MRLLLIFVSLIAAFSLLLNLKLLNERKMPKYKVLEVVDGDTFKIANDRRVRLMGVDAPETGKCLADKAKEKLSEMVLGKEVVLKDQFSDPYGRIMANVFINNKYINKEMLLSGLARMDYNQNPKRDELKKAYEEARNKKLGLFSGICLSNTPSNNCTIKGNVDDNIQKKFYYLQNCKNYSQVLIDLSTDDQWFCTEPEAVKSGFSKSKTCN